MIGRLRRAFAGDRRKPARANVTPLPAWPAVASRESLLAAIVMVSCALRTLGEPATVAEIGRLFVDVEPSLDEARIAAVLDGRAEAMLDARLPFALFRRVPAGRFEAWAFTREYRAVMNGAGLAPILRSL